jgi:hypothetical protein
MKTPEQIAKDFSKNLTHFMETSMQWRRENSVMYAVRDNRPILSGSTRRVDFIADRHNEGEGRKQNFMVVGLAPPYIRACIGMMTQFRKNFQATSTDPDFREEVDAMSDGMKWGVEISRFDHAYTLALEDMIIRGASGVVHELDFSVRNYPAGVPSCSKKHHIFFDKSGMESVNADSMAYCGYADPVSRDELDDYIARAEKKGKKALLLSIPDFRDELLEYSSAEDREDIVFLYHYFWHEFEVTHTVENVFLTKKQEVAQLIEADPNLYEIMVDFAKDHRLDLVRANSWTLSPSAFKDYAAMVELIEQSSGGKFPKGFDIEGEARVYYHAEFADGKLLKASQSFTQECHALNVMTCFYDHATGSYYGIMRGAAYIAEALNDAMNNLLTYSNRVATGGNISITNASTQLLDVAMQVRDGDQALFTPEGTVIQQLGTPDAGQTLLSTVALLQDLLAAVIGIPKEILGMMNNDTPAASLFRAQLQQVNISLAPMVNNCTAFLSNSAKIFRDMILEIAGNQDLQIIPRIAPGHKEESTFVLSLQNMARSYATSLIEQDMGEDAKKDAAAQVMEMWTAMPDQIRIATAPTVLKAMPLDPQIQDELMQAMQPPPPDPQAQELALRSQIANISMIEAQAAQLQAQGTKEQAEAKLSERDTLVRIEKIVSEIAKNNAMAQKYQADATINQQGYV